MRGVLNNKLLCTHVYANGLNKTFSEVVFQYLDVHICWPIVLRMWDVLLFEGNRVVLFRTAFALMELYGIHC